MPFNPAVKVLADAFGLGDEYVRFGESENYLLRPVYMTKADECYTTWTIDGSGLYTGGSVVVLCDGTLIPDGHGWRSASSRQNDFGKPLDWANVYRAVGASYMATEVRGIPEKLFIFERSPKLDFDRIRDELRAYRAAHPPRIFPAADGIFTATEPARN